MAFVDDIAEVEFAGAVALVASGARGLGVAIAKGLAMRGAQVYIAGDAIETKAQIWELSDEEFLGMCSVLPKQLSADELLAEVGLRHDKLNILVDDASEGWSSVFEHADAFYGLLLNGSGGSTDPAHIITIASSVQEDSSCLWSGKANHADNAQAMAAEFGDEHIVINCIDPARAGGADTTEVANTAIRLCIGAMPLLPGDEICNPAAVPIIRQSAEMTPFLQAKL